MPPNGHHLLAGVVSAEFGGTREKRCRGGGGGGSETGEDVLQEIECDETQSREGRVQH